MRFLLKVLVTPVLLMLAMTVWLCSILLELVLKRVSV